MEREYRFESEIQAAIFAEFGSGKPMRIWRNNVGKAYPVSMIPQLKKGISCRPIAFGVVGSADIMGILAGGRALAIEVKMPGEQLRPEQRTWRDMWIKYGGLHIVARSVGDVYDALSAEGIQCR